VRDFYITTEGTESTEVGKGGKRIFLTAEAQRRRERQINPRAPVSIDGICE
jgi:hypothetical protein